MNKIDQPQDLAMALFNGYLSLVRVLHRNGTLSIADLSNDLGNTLDFRRTKGIEPPENNQILEMLYTSVRQLEASESERTALQAEFDRKLQELRKPPETDGPK